MPGRGNRPVVEENGVSTVAVLSSERWRRLVPAFVTSSFAYLDRSNYSIGSARGLTDRLRLAGNTTASTTPRRNRSVSSNQ